MVASDTIAAPDVASAAMLTIRGLTKSFGRTPALVGADFDLREREIHGVVGASGAGKSTLARIIAGHEAYDAGEMTYRSYAVRLRNPREALRVGIALVPQDGDLVPDLSVSDNIVMPQFARPGRLDEATLRDQAVALLASFGQADAFPIGREVRRLTAAQRQIVGVARALGVRAKIILFDEPTAALSRCDADRLYDIMSRLRRAGCAVVVASRSLDVVTAIADRVTVLREGRTALKGRPASDIEALRQATAGTDRAPARPRGTDPGRRNAPVALAVDALAAPPDVRDISFAVHEGEILGLGGLVGAGRTATLEALFGLHRRRGGTVQVAGLDLRPGHPRAAIRAGLGFLPGGRSALGTIPHLTGYENMLVAHRGLGRLFGLGDRRRDAKAEALLDLIGLRRTEVARTAMRDLPYATQRKLALARWLLLEPKTLLLDDPLRGLDAAARDDMVAVLREVAAGGVGLVLAASAVDLIALADRIAVVRDGATVADVAAGRLDREALALLSTPRSAMRRHAALLRTLADDNGGASFLVLVDEDRVICLDAVIEDRAADPGFAPGQALALDRTAIPLALRRRGTGFVTERDGGLATLLAPIQTPRGRALGWVGLSLVPSSGLPPAAAVQHRIERLAATL